MRLHLDAAQTAAGTDYPVIPLEWELHKEPSNLHGRLRAVLGALPPGTGCVLSAVGHCGNWDGITAPCRLVIPNLDDCVTALLATDDRQIGNRKKGNVFYFHDSDTGEHSPAGYLRDLQRQYGTEPGLSIFGSMTQSYTAAEIIDTGAYDCYDPPFVEEIQENADLLRCTLDYAAGSNRILEKLLAGARAGCWDGQFLVYEAGETVRDADFSLGDAKGVRRPY